MKNRDITRQALHEYIDSLDDEGMYEFISDQEVHGAGIYDCGACASEHGESHFECIAVDADVDSCKRRFMEWMNKEAK